MEEENRDFKRVREVAEALSEHFDTVQIFCTRYDGKDIGTLTVATGLGNWYARTGHVDEWLLKEREATKVQIRKEQDE